MKGSTKYEIFSWVCILGFIVLWLVAWWYLETHCTQEEIDNAWKVVQPGLWGI